MDTQLLVVGAGPYGLSTAAFALEHDINTVVLERGSLHAAIVHRADTRWNVQAGPFEVRVTGTAFKVGWDPATEGFTLTLEEGRVVVSGCSLGEERVVAAGETFRATRLKPGANEIRERRFALGRTQPGWI